MPSKYIIHTKPRPHRFKAITQSGVVAWEEGCLKCAVCVKKKCVYQVYDHRSLDSRQMVDSIDNECMNCFRCIQSCPKELIQKTTNPEFKALGDSHWTPNIIARLWYQAESGKIPVSGAGYPGPFVGPGFDSMWTDMSEIVRPTRDGIHGREYISTAVDLGRTPRRLQFGRAGGLEGEGTLIRSIPIPMIMRVPSFGSWSDLTLKGLAQAAQRLGTYFAVDGESIVEALEDMAPYIVPILSEGSEQEDGILQEIHLAEIPWQAGWKKKVGVLNEGHPSVLLSVRMPLEKGVEERVEALAEAGISIIHVEGSHYGKAFDDETIYLKDGLRSVHRALVEKGCRDEVTLLASGGISMAEHVAKAIVCGADAVMIDFPAFIALECRMCRRCEKGLSCPVEIEKAPSDWVADRVVNLFGAWHNQLLEVMGAMGIRDIRRLRGEAGRAIFFEELDRHIFGPLGEIKEGYELE
jgi:ferredoxin